jgi:hypothetical protein
LKRRYLLLSLGITRPNSVALGLFCALSLALTSGRASAQSDSVKDLLEKREAAAQAKVENVKAGSGNLLIRFDYWQGAIG